MPLLQSFKFFERFKVKKFLGIVEASTPVNPRLLVPFSKMIVVSAVFTQNFAVVAAQLCRATSKSKIFVRFLKQISLFDLNKQHSKPTLLQQHPFHIIQDIWPVSCAVYGIDRGGYTRWR